MKKADIYYNGKLIYTVIGMQSESEQELKERVKKAILVVVPPAK